MSSALTLVFRTVTRLSDLFINLAPSETQQGFKISSFFKLSNQFQIFFESFFKHPRHTLSPGTGDETVPKVSHPSHFSSSNPEFHRKKTPIYTPRRIFPQFSGNRRRAGACRPIFCRSGPDGLPGSSRRNRILHLTERISGCILYGRPLYLSDQQCTGSEKGGSHFKFDPGGRPRG